MASLLTLPRELRDEIIDLLLLTHNPQPVDVSEFDIYEPSELYQPRSSAFPRPVKHHAAGLCQASRQIRVEVLQRSCSLRVGLRYALRIVIHRTETRKYGLRLEPRLRWVDTPVADATNLDRFDILFELNDLWAWGWVMTYKDRSKVGRLLDDAVSAVMYRFDRNDCKTTINKVNIEVTAKESPAFARSGEGLKGDNALEKLERILSDGGQELANFCIAMAIKSDCLGYVNLVEYTDTHTVSLLAHRTTKYWERIGSISLQAGTAVRKKTWYMDRKLMDRMHNVQDTKYHEFIAGLLLQRSRAGLDHESKLAEDHYEDPETVILQGSRHVYAKGNSTGVRIHEALSGQHHAKARYYGASKGESRRECFREEWKA
ncbi:uncharacterized protein J4E87_010978 [Alternaria ethzedia]|uniref:uncharacterized protein n=1 Tax=Alternaria ethzedia TaxID=181014 RepID=UPI0020C51E3C|nr:uncharacterized protein J4E87_010978 [Alternaria ethzedia]KAI4609861.1 hypothetical protein J4E87_010978 [Alternaria ethzedia]